MLKRRFRTLQRLCEKAEATGNLMLTAALLKQAAEEVGDVYTNKQKADHASSDGKLLAPTVIQIVSVSPIRPNERIRG